MAAPAGLAPDERDAIARVLAAGFVDTVAALPATAERRWWRVFATEDLDAWLIDWPVATAVHPHDHGGSAASIAVLRGELREDLLLDGGLRSSRLVPGSVHRVASSAVHDVVNPGPARATSLHVYSPPLVSMGFYDGDGRQLREEAVATEPVLWSTALPVPS